MCPKSHQVPEGRHFAEAVVPFHPYDGGVGAHARDTLWGWAQGRRPGKRAEPLLHEPRNAEGSTDSGVRMGTLACRAPGSPRRAHELRAEEPPLNPHHTATRHPRREGADCPYSARGVCTQGKGVPEEMQETKAYGLGVNSALINTNKSKQKFTQGITLMQWLKCRVLDLH